MTIDLHLQLDQVDSWWKGAIEYQGRTFYTEVKVTNSGYGFQLKELIIKDVEYLPENLVKKIHSQVEKKILNFLKFDR